jgi:ribosomal protein S18 acetylase RimI-like enzyme
MSKEATRHARQCGTVTSNRYGLRMRLRRVRPDESELLRRVRLGALADAPSAFESALPDERALPAEVWERRAAAGAAGDTAVTFVAEDNDGDCVGLVTGLWDGDPDHDAHVVSMWVDRRVRGRGLGRRLLDAAVDWAATRGARQVELWVTEGNEPAWTLYEKAGFAPTGVRAPFGSDPSRIGVQLSRPLTG